MERISKPRAPGRAASRSLVGAFAVAAVLGSAVAGAQESVDAYPSKPIRVILPFAAGGPSDIITRLIGQHLTEVWKQPLVIDNKPGAGGVIGTEMLAKSPPDGYTLGVGSIGTHAINVTLFSKLPYDAINDFAPITILASYPTLLVVHPSIPAANVREFVALLKANPDKYSFASAGLGSSAHLVGELFKLSTGTNMVHVPYKGDAPAMSDVVSGQVSSMFANLSANAMGFVQNGRLKALAVTSPQPSAFAPGVPALAETIPGFQARTWAALFAPGKTPPAIVNKIHAEIVRVLQIPAVRTRYQEFGASGAGITPAEFAAYVKSEIDLWRPAVQKSGAKAD